MGCTCKLFAIGAMCYGISALLAYAETRSEWASEYYEVEFLEGEPDLCDHNRIGSWYGLWTHGARGCNDDEGDEKYSGDDYPNMKAIEFARSSTTILGIGCIVIAGYFVLTGCCGRSRRLETTAGVALLAGGVYVCFAIVYWGFRFKDRPKTEVEDLTFSGSRDREVCDIGCKMAGAAGAAAVILGLVVNAIAKDKEGGGPVAAEDEPPALDV